MTSRWFGKWVLLTSLAAAFATATGCENGDERASHGGGGEGGEGGTTGAGDGGSGSPAGEGGCYSNAVWSFRVYVQDSSSGAAICDATVIASDGATETQLDCLGDDDCPCVGVAEQLGTFQITATKSDYESGAATIVVDQQDACHVVTKDATLQLDPQ